MEGLTPESPFKGKTGIRRLWNALHYSLDGLRAALRYESAFRMASVTALILIPTALFLPVNPIGKAVLIGSVMLIPIVELLNSAIEASVDHTSLAQHPLAKRAKDMGSAAQLLCLASAAMIWTLVLLA